MIQEFKEFITTGNLLTLAIGFIMGLAFAALVSSFVEDLIMPIIAIPFGEPNFSSLTLEINDSVIAYGAFITSAVVLVLTALAVFMFIVKPYNAYESRLRQEEEEDAGPSEIELLVDIRDSLVQQGR